MFLLNICLSDKAEKIQSNTTGIRNLDFTTYEALRLSIPFQDQLVEQIEAIEKQKELINQLIDNV